MSNLSVVESLLLKSGFPPFRPSGELMDELAGLTGGARRGIYVHVLGGGTQFYVGLSIDVRSRYLQHLETYGSIEKSTFLHLPEPVDMAPVEMEHIARLRDAGATLLNVLQPAADMSAEDVAEMFDPDAQQAWLDDMTAYHDGGPRAYDPKDLPRFAKRHASLLAHKNYSEELIDLVSYFIRAFIPTPDKSEGYLWTLNCLTDAFTDHSAKALFRISVHRPEVLTVVVNDKDPEMAPFFIMFTAAKWEGAAADAEALAEIPDVEVHDLDFKTAKFPHFRVKALTVEAAWRLFANPAFIRGIKRAVFELMRSGQTPKNFSQSHCLPLCAQVMSRQPRIPASAGTHGRATLQEVLDDPSLDSVWLAPTDYLALLEGLFMRAARGHKAAAEGLLSHANRCRYRSPDLMARAATVLLVTARRLRPEIPEVWRTYYPLLGAVSPAIASGASLAICGFRTVPKADPLLAVRDLLLIVRGVETQEAEKMAAEARETDERFDHEGSIVAGILHTGDERVVPLVEESWKWLTRGARIRFFKSSPPITTYAYLQFAITRLDESHGDEELFVAVYNALEALPTKAIIRRIAEVNFEFGGDIEGLPVQVVEDSGSTFAEYAEGSMKALKAIAKRESKPKLVPDLIKSWLIWDDEFTAEVEAAQSDDDDEPAT